MTLPANHRQATTEVTTTTDDSIDLLADDALDAPRRAALLRSFDDAADQDGWRRCALALLEAQAWRRAMGDPPVAAAPVTPVVRTERRRHGFPRLAMAAVVAAFAVGTLLGGAAIWQHGPRGDGSSVTNTASKVSRPAAAPAPAAPRSEVVTNVALPTSRPAPLPDYVRRQLERDGYEVQGTGSRMIPVELADGRTVTVPVATLTYQYVGRRIR